MEPWAGLGWDMLSILVVFSLLGSGIRRCLLLFKLDKV